MSLLISLWLLCKCNFCQLISLLPSSATILRTPPPSTVLSRGKVCVNLRTFFITWYLHYLLSIYIICIYNVYLNNKYHLSLLPLLMLTFFLCISVLLNFNLHVFLVFEYIIQFYNVNRKSCSTTWAVSGFELSCGTN